MTGRANEEYAAAPYPVDSLRMSCTWEFAGGSNVPRLLACAGGRAVLSSRDADVATIEIV